MPFILSLNYLNVGTSYCTDVVFCCYFLIYLFYTLYYILTVHGLCLLLK